MVRRYARRRSYGDDVNPESKGESKKTLPVGSFNYEKASGTKRALVRRRSIGEVYENELILQRDTQLSDDDSFEREVQKLLEQFESISRVRFSNSKVAKVFLHNDIVLPDVDYTEAEQTLGFERTKPKKRIPEILNVIRYLITLFEKIKKFQDDDFYGKWVVWAKGSLVDPKFALKKIHWLYDYALVLMMMAVRLNSQDDDKEIKLKPSFFEKSEYDQDFDITDKEKLPEQRRQIADSVHRNMAKFFIAMSTLEAPINALEGLWDTLTEDLEKFLPRWKERVSMLLEHISSVFYRLYSDFFCCDRDG